MASATQPRIERLDHPRDRSPDGERDESSRERLDRNTLELLQELRVAGADIQVLFAFLLIVPFNNRFDRLSSFDRYDYFVTLLCIAVAAVLLISPTIHHRLLFRLQQKPYLIRTANRFAIAGIGFLSAGMVGILVLISDVMFGGVAAGVIGAIAALVIGAAWFGVPLARRRAI